MHTRIVKLGIQGLLLSYALVALLPLSIGLLDSLKDPTGIFTDPFGLPYPPRWGNYIEAWQRADFSISFKNSLWVSGVSVVGILAFGSMAAYALTRLPVRSGMILSLYFLAGLMLPFRLAVLPIFTLLRDLHLLDTRTGLILVYMGIGMPISIFILAHFLRGVPREIEEAARIDGAGDLRIYWRIVLPLLRPALATVAILNFVTIWNDLFLPLVLLRSDRLKTIPLGISEFFNTYSHRWDLLFAGLEIALIPIVLIYLLLPRQFAQGWTGGLGGWERIRGKRDQG
ncbi:MAG: carbohydrate ABC transporter permease [Candidatus Bipolaricaulia bacterium]